MRGVIVALVTWVGLTTSFAIAHHVPQIQVRGTVLTLDRYLLTVVVHDGSTVRVWLLDDYHVLAVTEVKRASITPGMSLHMAARRQPDGTLTALEVVVFPESTRGMGEGHYPWAAAPESTVTNATVTKVVEHREGLWLTLTSGQRDVQAVLLPHVPVLTYRRGTKDLVQRGAYVFLTAVEQPNGLLTSARVFVTPDRFIPDIWTPKGVVK
jgi:hypothetical protein